MLAAGLRNGQVATTTGVQAESVESWLKLRMLRDQLHDRRDRHERIGVYRGMRVVGLNLDEVHFNSFAQWPPEPPLPALIDWKMSGWSGPSTTICAAAPFSMRPRLWS